MFTLSVKLYCTEDFCVQMSICKHFHFLRFLSLFSKASISQSTSIEAMESLIFDHDNG